MRRLTPSINIKPDKMEFITIHLCDHEEVIYTSKVQLDFPPGIELPTQEGYEILTYGYIYLLTKSNKELLLQQRICLFNCDEILFNNEKGKNVKPSVSIKTLPDLNVFTILDGKKMDLFYEYITYAIFIISNGVTSQIKVPKLYPPIQNFSYTVPFAIYKRSLYFIHYDMKTQKIPRTLIEGVNYFNDTSIYSRGQLTIGSNFHPDNFTEYYGKAIGMESQIISVKFQDFKEDLTVLFGSISKSLSTPLKIVFYNYESASPVFNFEKVANSKIESFEFTNSNFSIVDNFLTGCFNYNYSITKLKIRTLQMKLNDLINFFDCINKTRCFLSLTSFELSEIDFDSFPIEIFRRSV